MTPDTPPVAPEAATDHPLAIALRKTYWQLDLLIDDFSHLSAGEFLEHLVEARDSVRSALSATPDDATPVLSLILPSLRGITLALNAGKHDAAMDLVVDLQQRFTPSPARGGNH